MPICKSLPSSLSEQSMSDGHDASRKNAAPTIDSTLAKVRLASCAHPFALLLNQLLEPLIEHVGLVGDARHHFPEQLLLTRGLADLQIDQFLQAPVDQVR